MSTLEDLAKRERYPQSGPDDQLEAANRHNGDLQPPSCQAQPNNHVEETLQRGRPMKSALALVSSLSFLDRFLALWVILAMIIGVVIGKFANGVAEAFGGATFNGVSIPIVVGLLVMMWPTLTKVQYEQLPRLFSSRAIYIQIAVSLVLNWIVGPFVMLGVAYATLPDLETYRTGVIMVGLARCIAMVIIWNQLAGGDHDYCAILVIINSILQIALYSPYSVLFVTVIGGFEEGSALKLNYGPVAVDVLIYLGIPLAAGIVTRFAMIALLGRSRFENRFLPIFSPLALIGLLYTIIVIFALQATHILDNLGPVFRVFVPMILYFVIMWTGTFMGVYWWNRRTGSKSFGYEVAVVQAFTAGSNNFELAIAVCVATYGVNSDQALAATIGPLVEVPGLLCLTWVSLFLHKRLSWRREGVSELAEGDVAGREEYRVGELGRVRSDDAKAGYFGGADAR